MNATLWNRAALAIVVVVLAIGGPWLARQLESLPRSAVAGRSEQRIVTLDVTGMTCDMCAAAIRGRLTQVAGVSTVDVRYRERRAFVVCKRTVADTALTAAVQLAGPGFLAAVESR